MDPSSDPPAKRVKLDSEATPASQAPAPVVAATTSTSTAAAAAAAAPAASSATAYSFEGETGLFGTIIPTLGIRASTEDEVGISEYADASVLPFSGIIKHRFTDFLVFEVGLDGQVVRLKDIQGPQKQKREKVKEEPKSEEPKEGASAASAPASAAGPEELWTLAAESIMTPLVGADKLAEFQSFLSAGPPARNAPKNTPRPLFQSPAIEVKEARTAFHKGLREAFNGQLLSEMKELEDKSQVIVVSWKMGGGNAGQKPRQSKAEKVAAQGGPLPPYIHFTLQKTNKEMHDALSGLCRTLHLQSRDLGTAGTKDKRAVTVQRVTMKRGNKTIEDIWRAARGGGGGGRGRGRGRGGGGWSNGPDRGVRIGDVEYGQRMLDLGMLKGNKFVVTLRDVEADSPTTINRAMLTLRDRGFINYYGMQRFGTSPIPTHAIGLALLRSDWALATHLILRARDGEGEDVQLARQVWREGKLGEAIRLMPRRAVAERAVMEGLQKSPTDHLTALSRIPKNLRMMYVHAWQSYIWNLVVSERVKLHGCTEPIVGDLVLIDGEATGDGELNAAGAAEPEVPVVEPLDPNLDDDLPTPSTAGPLSSSRAQQISRIAKARPLIQADLNAKTYTIFDVVLPLPGYAVTYPEGSLGERYREIMRNDKIDPDDLFRKQKEYSLGGAYRKIMHLPSDVSHKLLLYTSSSQDLAQSDEDILLGRPKPEVIEYTSEEPIPAGHSLALQLEITLGSSTYCTMALREILKVKTSGAHQRMLTEQMEERLKFPAPAEAETAPVVVEEETKMEVEEAPKSELVVEEKSAEVAME